MDKPTHEPCTICDDDETTNDLCADCRKAWAVESSYLAVEQAATDRHKVKPVCTFGDW